MRTAKTCEDGDAILAATTIKQAEDAVEDMLQRLDMGRTRTTMLNDELAVLQTDNDRLHREVAAKRPLAQRWMIFQGQCGPSRGARQPPDRLAATAEVASLTRQNDALRLKQQASEALTAELAARTSLSTELAGLRTDYDDIAGELLDTAKALRDAEATITTLPSLDEMAQRTAEIGAARNEVQRLTDERDAIRRELASATAALER